MEEIINNVMQSPENTNPNVLRSQLSEIDGGGASGALVVNMVRATSDYETYTITADKTYADIAAAVIAGIPVVADVALVVNDTPTGIHDILNLSDFRDIDPQPSRGKAMVLVTFSKVTSKPSVIILDYTNEYGWRLNEIMLTEDNT